MRDEHEGNESRFALCSYIKDKFKIILEPIYVSIVLTCLLFLQGLFPYFDVVEYNFVFIRVLVTELLTRTIMS